MSYDRVPIHPPVPQPRESQLSQASRSYQELAEAVFASTNGPELFAHLTLLVSLGAPVTAAPLQAPLPERHITALLATDLAQRDAEVMRVRRTCSARERWVIYSSAVRVTVVGRLAHYAMNWHSAKQS